MKAEIEVLKPGLFSAIQDLGRFGYLKYGIPLGGVMDSFSAQTANLLLQNSADCAVLEITQMGPKLHFPGAVKIGITGADLSPKINEIPIKNNKVYSLAQGDTLSFGKRKSGCRAYLGIAGGFQTEEILGSKSWLDGVTTYSRLEKGMKLSYTSEDTEIKEMHASLKVTLDFLEANLVEVYKGPEFERLSAEQKRFLITAKFCVGKNYNRMAVQMEDKLENSLDPIITGPVVPGTVQLTPGGNLIILMRDCQTTGGYPRVLQLKENSINLLSQKVMGDYIYFKMCSSSLK